MFFVFKGGTIMKIKYKIFNPAGNITALVIGDDYTIEERKIINDKIMERNSAGRWKCWLGFCL